jgi:glycosyltransferase involved in cell wall biosynthesis
MTPEASPHEERAIARHRTLHIACMPFPTSQGTQAAVRAMVEALDGTLLSYGEGAYPCSPSFEWVRAPRLPGSLSTRSGPSLRKVATDSLVLARARELAADHTLIVAHHVEAAAIAFALGRPFLYVAHTALGPELPAYAPPWLAGLLSRAGALADRAIVSRSPAACAVSPMLAARLSQYGSIEYLPVPWPVLAPIAHDASRARRSIAYVGNLDAYQGWEDAVEAAARIGARLVVGTQSDTAALERHAARHAAEVVVRRLANEADRRRIYAEAHVVVVPRRLEGGVPVKLLDALARGAAVVTTERARAGLAIDHAVRVAFDDDVESLARAIDELLEWPEQRRRLGEAGRAFIADEHSRVKFRSRFSSLLSRLSIRRAGASRKP